MSNTPFAPGICLAGGHGRPRAGMRRDTEVAVEPARVGRRLPRPARATQEGASMLVLSRQRDETIMIGDDIEVTVVDIRGDKVRLGITAPREISVHRKEVYDAIRRENRAAAQVKPEDVTGAGKPAPKPDDKGEKK